MEGGERLRTGRVGRAQPGVGSVRLGQGAVAVEGQPCVQRVVLTLGHRQVGFDQLARRDLTGPQRASHLVGSQADEVLHRAQPASYSPARIAGTTM